jgi:hypothetical protein
MKGIQEYDDLIFEEMKMFMGNLKISMMSFEFAYVGNISSNTYRIF